MRANLALLVAYYPLAARGCLDGGKDVACCVDAAPSGSCATCLGTTDARAAWGSPCVWLSSTAVAGQPQRCQPSKWWSDPDAGPLKAKGVTRCVNCSAGCPAAAAPAPCTASPRAACWPGHWTAPPQSVGPKGQHALGIVDAPLVGNGVVSAALALGRCTADNSTLCHFIDRTDAFTPATGAISNCGYSAAGGVTVGQVAIASDPPPASTAVFNAKQDAATASVAVSLPLTGGGELNSETKILREENVMVISLWTSNTTQTVSANASIPPLPNGGCFWSDKWSDKKAVVASRQLGSPYQDQLHSTVGLRRHIKYAIAMGSSHGQPCSSGSVVCLSLAPGQRVQLVVSVVHSFDIAFADPVRPAANLTNTLVENDKELTRLVADHAAWWSAFWANTAHIETPHSPAAEQMWYGSLYILASGNRGQNTRMAAGQYAGDGRLPPPMGLVWPKTTDSPAFSGSYTMNYNQQGIFYGIHAANASWLGAANEQAMMEYIPRGQNDARAQFNSSGINMDCEIFAWGQTTTTVGDQGQRSNAALSAAQFANHWLYTRDTDWLRANYAFSAEVIRFFTDYLTLEEDGRYHSHNDCLNELCSGDLGDHAESNLQNDDPHVTIALLRFLFPVVIEMADVLGVDSEELPQWRHISTRIAHYVEATQPNTSTQIFGRFRGALHPPRVGTELTFMSPWPGWDPELNTNATLRAMQSASGLYLKAFRCGNCFPQFAPGAVRAAADVEGTWAAVLSAIECGWQQNMLLKDGCNGMATESIGGMAVAAEALLGQGQRGYLSLFPALPLGQPAVFRNLRAVGGLLVSASRGAAKTSVANVTITNDARDGSAQTVGLLSPWGAKPFVVQEVGGSEEPKVSAMPSAVEANVFKFEAKAGASYRVAPA
jgi:hypothetical protein